MIWPVLIAHLRILRTSFLRSQVVLVVVVARGWVLLAVDVLDCQVKAVSLLELRIKHFIVVVVIFYGLVLGRQHHGVLIPCAWKWLAIRLREVGLHLMVDHNGFWQFLEVKILVAEHDFFLHGLWNTLFLDMVWWDGAVIVRRSLQIISLLWWRRTHEQLQIRIGNSCRLSSSMLQMIFEINHSILLLGIYVRIDESVDGLLVLRMGRCEDIIWLILVILPQTRSCPQVGICSHCTSTCWRFHRQVEFWRIFWWSFVQLKRRLSLLSKVAALWLLESSCFGRCLPWSSCSGRVWGRGEHVGLRYNKISIHLKVVVAIFLAILLVHRWSLLSRQRLLRRRRYSGISPDLNFVISLVDLVSTSNIWISLHLPVQPRWSAGVLLRFQLILPGLVVILIIGVYIQLMFWMRRRLLLVEVRHYILVLLQLGQLWITLQIIWVTKLNHCVIAWIALAVAFYPFVFWFCLRIVRAAEICSCTLLQNWFSVIFGNISVFEIDIADLVILI